MKLSTPALALLGLLAACSAHDKPLVGYACPVDTAPLALDAQSSLGFSPTQALDLAVERFETVAVEWTYAVAAPYEETFHFHFGTPSSAEERSASADCGGRQWVSVEVPVQITSASGHLSASDTVEIWALTDANDALQVFVDWPEEEQRMNSTVSGPYADAAQAHDAGLYLTHLSPHAYGFFDSRHVLEQGIGVVSEYDNSQAASSASLYTCRPSGETPGNCLTFPTP